jgi:surface carbohydrate biosynthesis protein (TIGR04326 family)
MSELDNYLIKNKINLFQKIENKDKEITHLYEKTFEEFLKIKILKKSFFLYFKQKKKNILLQTDIGEKNLYKNRNEITDFFKFVSKKYIKNIKPKNIIKTLLLKNYKKKNIFLNILKNFLKSNYLFVRYFLYSFKFILKNFFKKNKENRNNEIIIFSYLLNCKDPINFKDNYWGEISTILKDKKITWIHHTFINKENIKDPNLEKFYLKSKKYRDKDEHFFLEEFISINSFFIIYFSYLINFFKNLFLFFLIKLNFKKNNLLDAFYFFHENIIIESMFGSSFMRALIFNENFKLFFRRFKLFKKIFYLKENLSWEKTLLDNLNHYFSNKKKIYGYLHTPVRFWDLKLNQINEKIHFYPKENLLVSSLICKKKLQDKLSSRHKIHLVESLRFPLKNKIKLPSINIKHNNKFLLLGSLNEESTQKMINQVIFYIKSCKYNIKIDVRLHPLSNFKLDKKIVTITKSDLSSLLTNNKYNMIFLDADSSISLELILNNFNFFIYNNPNNLNTSFLRNNKKFYFFSDYKQIKTFSKKNFYKGNKNKNFNFLSSDKYIRWQNLLGA